jgi:alpha-L-fucosidase 2
MDEKFLKNRAYPFMRECMVFYEQLLEPDENGVLHVPVTHSPEWQGNLPEAWCSDSTIDLALIKYAARASAEAAARVGAKDEQSRWQHLADHLAPYPEDPEKWGLQLFPGQDLIESHHHHSHAAPIYPCGDLNIEGSDLDRDLIDRTLHALEFRGTGGWIGFSFSWMACIAARLGRGNQVWRMLQLYMDAFISPNTFNLNGDFKRLGVSCLHYDAFCMEAGPAAAAGILEMLLQSWKRIIRVFPALPEHWRDVSFEQLRAEGAFLVSATMAGGQITEVRIESERGGVCRVKNTFGMEMVLLRNEDETPCRGELIEWESQPGETSWIRPSEPATRAERRDAGQRMTNPFGLKTPETCARLSLTVAPNDVSDKP